MSWRTVVISNNAKLDYQMGYMVVRRMDTVKIHLSEMETLIIESTAVSLTAALLSELSKKKIKVIFCDENIKKAVWTEIVTEKIRKQAEYLEFLNCDESDMLYGYISEVQFADTTNREGHAAKVYFNALFGLDFTRTEDNSTNAALNYGYSLLLSTFNRCITSNGYITQLGLFHDNMFNPFNLASDLMEPFRPIVDRKVKEMNPTKFEHDEKMEVVSILQNEVVINGRSEFLNNAIKIYCKSIFDAINDEDISEIRFYKL